jgi:protein RecA
VRWWRGWRERGGESKRASGAEASCCLPASFSPHTPPSHSLFTHSATISTGALTLDAALGGGLPKGRIVEIYGPESSGKTTIALHAIAEAQRAGGRAALIDAEHAFDPVYAEALGIDNARLLVSQPDSGEMALEIVDQLVRR